MPISYRAAEDEYEECLGVTQEIQGQLGQKNRLSTEGGRLGYVEYDEWRTKAKGKLRIVTQRLRFLKRWLKDNNPQEDNEKAELKDALVKYGFHLDECLWWSDKPCSCGLDVLLDKYGMDRIERDDETTGTDTKTAGATG